MITAAKPYDPAQALASDDSDVPAKLIKTAIRLYGEHGCHAVSARQIIKEAGVLNDAAIRYYFGKKQDLLRACVQAIGVEGQPIMQAAWAALDARKADSAEPPLGPREVIDTMFSGMTALHLRHPSAVKLLARIVREEGPEGQKLQMDILGDWVWRFEDELAAVLPNKPAATIRVQAAVSISCMLYGLVDQQLIQSLPAAATAAGRAAYAVSAEQLRQSFVDFLTTGIAGPSST